MVKNNFNLFKLILKVESGLGNSTFEFIEIRSLWNYWSMTDVVA